MSSNPRDAHLTEHQLAMPDDMRDVGDRCLAIEYGISRVPMFHGSKRFGTGSSVPVPAAGTNVTLEPWNATYGTPGTPWNSWNFVGIGSVKIERSMTPRQYRAGQSVEDYCRQCHEDRIHTVIVVDAHAQPLRVTCDFCRSEHNFRGGPAIRRVIFAAAAETGVTGLTRITRITRTTRTTRVTRVIRTDLTYGQRS
jgi:hypothetical protein